MNFLLQSLTFIRAALRFFRSKADVRSVTFDAFGLSSPEGIKVRGEGFEPGFNLGSNFSFLLLEFKPGFNLGLKFWKSSSCSRVQRTQY